MDLATLIDKLAESGKASKETIGELREELAGLQTAESIATKASDLVRDGNLFIPNGDPGREAAIRWWTAAQTWRGWTQSA